ncbi:YecA family protein, partial [Pseudoalteromonas issachenkonii]
YRQALHEVIEYVRVSALLCLAELGKEQNKQSTKKTLH